MDAAACSSLCSMYGSGDVGSTACIQGSPRKQRPLVAALSPPQTGADQRWPRVAAGEHRPSLRATRPQGQR